MGLGIELQCFFCFVKGNRITTLSRHAGPAPSSYGVILRCFYFPDPDRFLEEAQKTFHYLVSIVH